MSNSVFNEGDLESQVAALNTQIATLQNNKLASEIDITSYVSSNRYTVPSDGFVVLINANGATGYATIGGSSAGQFFDIGYNTGRYGLFVKKGQIVFCGGSPTACRYYPLS